MVVGDNDDRAHPALDRPLVMAVYPAVAASVRAARNAVAAIAEAHGASPQCVDDVRLAVSEAATNVVVHAYEEHTTGSFRVLAVIGGDQLVVIVEDDGRGLSSPARTPGLGAGLTVMRETATQALFREREHGGSSVQLRFTLRPHGEGEGI
ncbi:ATP-binding protein [Conexibacter sp. DBS9H8]|uniref:ATP-binding protein n=1 Tax=Conexibacter sp. DBS9H8 TaxID=2937801 RepID=UPI00200CB9F7|nr:ATP-binding protein [Conexibacter sp. DBS9H8]